MKYPNHFGRWLACVLLCLLLAGCSMPGEQVQVEELLRAPKLSGDYGDVQTALNDWLGESAQLKYPMQGDLLSPFLLQDLDGDGRQDAAVLYTTAQSSNVCIAILQKDDADIWHVRQNVEGLADTVESVGLAQLQPGDATQLVVGYTAAQGDHYLAVYSYTDGVLSTILEQQYQQYLVEDITGGGNQDLILMSTLEDGGVQIELLTVDKEGSFQQVAVMGLSANRFAGCASVAAGVGADGRHYLVLDGWTGISGNNLASVLLRFDEDTQQMVPADQISTEKLYTASLRNVPSLVSQDLDGDGIVEIPTQPDEAGLLNMSQSRRMDFIVWMDYTSRRPEKSFGLLDEETNCYIELPTEWEGQPQTYRQRTIRRRGGAAHRGRGPAGHDGTAGPDCGQLYRVDQTWHCGVAPDAGPAGPGCGDPGCGLQPVKRVVSAELKTEERPWYECLWWKMKPISVR